MSKQLYVDPRELRKPGVIHFNDIPMNEYQKTVADVKDEFTKEELVQIFHDMRYLREFETMLDNIKKTNHYYEIEYNHPGPAHLSIGQEATAVGEAFCLDENDFTFGSHRSHGEILAKGLSAIHKMDADKLKATIEGYFDGKITNVVKKYMADDCADIREEAVDFLLYGAMAETFARENGFNRGLGGSMHTFFTPFGIYPNNAIVGGSGGIAAGAALYKKVNKKEGIVVANLGDASLGRGPVLEALGFSCMDQYNDLWEDGFKGGLPILFFINNNTYGMGGQTLGETMGWQQLARLGSGFTPDQMHAERVDGFNPLAVIDAVRRKKKLIEEGNDGPVLLDVITYRFCGHSPSDSSSYRTEEEIEDWKQYDPIKIYAQQLVEAGVATQEELDAIDAAVIAKIKACLALAVNDEISPRMDMKGDPDSIAKLMFSNQHVEKMEDRPCDLLIENIEDNPQVKRVKAKNHGVKADLKSAAKPTAKDYVLRDGLFEPIIRKFYEDPTLIAYGEDNRDWGGAYAVYRGLTESLPYHRFFNAPISEAAILGSAVGYAMCGGRVIAEIMYCDFLGCCGDELFNQMSKWQAMSAGVLKMPLILRVSVGSKYGAQHSQDWTSICAHIPGLKICFPTTPYDAKGLMTAALNGTDPVIFFESQRIYGEGELFHEIPDENYEITIGEPDIKREGSDLTILTIGATLYRALEAADELKDKYGISAEVIDCRSMVPFDYAKVLESVKKTGKIVLASDACERASYLKNIAEGITEMAFDYLDAPPVVVGARNWITPAHELEKSFFPQPSWILDAVNEKIMPLKGYVPTRDFTNVEQMRNSKAGV